MCYLVFLSFPWVLKLEGHVAIDIFIMFLSSKRQAILNKVNSFACMVACVILFIFGSATIWEIFLRREYVTGEWAVPRYVLLLPFVLSNGLLAFQFLRRWLTPEGKFTFPKS
jgi:TRAP-type C4-dicarboxylate transport system permease small subunit